MRDKKGDRRITNEGKLENIFIELNPSQVTFDSYEDDHNPLTAQ